MLGSQSPTHLVKPSGRVYFTDADDAIELWESVNPPLYPWQVESNRLILGKTKGGKPACQTIGISVPRQNGKTYGTLPAELFWCIIEGFSVMHTAHEVKTAGQAFKEMLNLCDPDRGGVFGDYVEKVSHTNGKEAIWFRGGGVWRIGARSKGAARGFTVDKLILDEALIADDATQAALMPIMSAARSGKPQIVLLGTPPSPDMPSDWFRRVRTSCLERQKGKGKRFGWLEFSAGPDDDPALVETWCKANPSFGRSLIPEWVEAEYAQMPLDKFRRERLGVWDEDAKHTHVIPPDIWAAVSDPLSQIDIEAEVSVSVDMGPDRKTCSIAVAGWRIDGDPHVEVAEHQGSDPGWVAPWLGRFCDQGKATPLNVRAIVVDDFSPAKALLPDIEAATGVKVTVTRSGDLTVACGRFYDLVVQRKLRHRDQPLLTNSLLSAAKRRIGDAGGWAWNRKDADSDLTPLVSSTLALFGLSASKVAKQRKKRSNKVYVASRW